MQKSERLGRIGWAALVVLLAGILAVLVFGFAAAIYAGLLLTLVALVTLVLLCQGKPASG